MVVTMICDKIHKPVFTRKQIEECIQCSDCHNMRCGIFKVRIVKSIAASRAKTKYPSTARMGLGFGYALARHTRSGFKKRSKKEQEKVMAICRACEPYFVPETKVLGPRCKKCGCCMSLKTRWATAHCDLGKW